MCWPLPGRLGVQTLPVRGPGRCKQAGAIANIFWPLQAGSLQRPGPATLAAPPHRYEAMHHLTPRGLLLPLVYLWFVWHVETLLKRIVNYAGHVQPANKEKGMGGRLRCLSETSSRFCSVCVVRGAFNYLTFYPAVNEYIRVVFVRPATSFVGFLVGLRISQDNMPMLRAR